MSKFTHFDESGRARMVDITEKQATNRVASARSSVIMPQHVHEAIIEQKIKKGNVLTIAEIAGIMGTKQTATLIPLCHPLPLSGVTIKFDWEHLKDEQYKLVIDAEVKTVGSTGVEMEALTAVMTTALTVYDMCKALDKRLVIGETYVVKKSGGKSGDYEHRRKRPFSDVQTEALRNEIKETRRT